MNGKREVTPGFRGSGMARRIASDRALIECQPEVETAFPRRRLLV